MSADVQGDASEDATSVANLAAIHESAGDYAGALVLFDQALLQLEASESDPDSLRIRQIKRSRARALGLQGDTDAALEVLASLRRQSQQLDGEQPFEVAMIAWQGAVLARAAGRAEAGLRALEEAVRLMRAQLPDTHYLFAYAHRLRGYFLSLQGELSVAAAEVDAGLTFLQTHGSVPFDLAVMRAERARIHALMDEPEQARALLHEALPVLRAAVLPTEVNRAAAERVAVMIGE